MTVRPGKTLTAAGALLVCLSLSACRSAFVQAQIVNRSGGPVRLIEVDYPSASFGTQQIAGNATFRYRFKVQDSGPVKISYTTADRQNHTATGPILVQGEQGSLTITIGNDGKVSWTPVLSAGR